MQPHCPILVFHLYGLASPLMIGGLTLNERASPVPSPRSAPPTLRRRCQGTAKLLRPFGMAKAESADMDENVWRGCRGIPVSYNFSFTLDSNK